MALKKETVRVLSNPELQAMAGGGMYFYSGNNCNQLGNGGNPSSITSEQVLINTAWQYQRQSG